MSEYFPDSRSLGERVKVELDFSNYARKTDVKLQHELIRHLLLKGLI